MMERDPYELLNARRRRFSQSETTAGWALDALSAELRDPRVSGFRVVARTPGEFLLTFAGFGLYIRFAYSTEDEFLEYGTWHTTDLGNRAYVATGAWSLSDRTFGGMARPGELVDRFYSAMVDSLDAVERRHGTTRRSAYDLRSTIPENVTPAGQP